jgi:hypothetical protein
MIARIGSVKYEIKPNSSCRGGHHLGTFNLANVGNRTNSKDTIMTHIFDIELDGFDYYDDIMARADAQADALYKEENDDE